MGMNTSRPRKELNILLLGQTGCGKSTFINALCNYFQYKTLDEALQKLDGLHTVIPTRYPWTLPNFEQEEVVLGEHENECCDGVGVSATQWPREIVYNYGRDYIIRLIDTPGFADTSGTDKDNVNSERILKFIHQYSHLHAVCILFKSNETRNTQLFRYCFNTLFTQMHRNIFKNIICVFTFTKGSNWGPGGTLAILRDNLREIQELKGADFKDHINLGQHNIVCFDNDCFNFLGAVKKGTCQPSEKDNYVVSFEKSSEAAKKLLELVKKLQPYSVHELTSLQKVRQESIKLIKVYKELQDELEAEFQQLEQTTDKLQLAEEKIQNLIRLTYRITKHTREGRFIMCFNKKCEKRDDLGNYNMCRNDSNAWGSFLKFDMLGSTCRYCNCDMRYHSDVTECIEKRREVDKKCEELKKEEIIKRNRSKLELIQNRMNISKLKHEKQVLSEVLHQISNYTSKNSMVSPRDMSGQIKLDIESEKGKRIVNVGKIKRLEDDLKVQELLCELHDKYQGTMDSSTEEVNSKLASLQKLPYVGQKLNEFYTADVDTCNFYEPLIVNPLT